MARRKSFNYTTLFAIDGFDGTGAVNDTLVATDTTMGVDTLSLADSVKIVPKGARFSTAGILTVREVTASNNSQQWTLTIDATGGTFDLVLNGETAATIAFDATSATIQTALEGLASVTAGDVTVAGDGPHTITMAANLANLSTNTLTSVATSLTGGGSTAVVAVVQDGLNTWELTFTPAIATGSVPLDDDVITFYPRQVEIEPEGTGVLNWTEGKETIVRRSRGRINGATKGDEQEMQVTTAAVLDWLRASSGNPITIYEALNQLGDASDWLTSAGRSVGFDYCEPFCVDLKAVDAPDCGSEEAEVFIFRRFYDQALSPSVEDGNIDISGICTSTKVDAQRVANDDYTIATTN